MTQTRSKHLSDKALLKPNLNAKPLPHPISTIKLMPDTATMPAFYSRSQSSEPVSVTKGVRIFLASRSPRRRELLSDAGYLFDFDHPGLEDSELVDGDVTPRQWVASLAYLKARAGVEVARQTRRTPDIVLGADTACVMDGRLIGTPRNAAEARTMIAAFADREHEVVSGLALVCMNTGRRTLASDAARVWVGSISDTEIDEYIASGMWQGKAGAYNLTERIAAGWPIRYEGDPATIMGLPMIVLADRLERFLRQPPPKESIV